MTNVAIAALMLFASDQVAPPQRTSNDDNATSVVTDRQQTTITSGDNSNGRSAAGGRILSRRETRLNTRITKDMITTIGRGSGASRTADKREPLLR